MRRTLSKTSRFRVLSRDHFTCRYCGRSAPVVVLEVDHIHPHSLGGTNDFDNLVTACHDCNNGKRAELLPVPVSVAPTPSDKPLAPVAHPDICDKCSRDFNEIRTYAADWEELRGRLGYVAYYHCPRGHCWNSYWMNEARWPADDIQAEIDHCNAEWIKMEQGGDMVFCV